MTSCSSALSKRSSTSINLEDTSPSHQVAAQREFLFDNLHRFLAYFRIFFVFSFFLFSLLFFFFSLLPSFVFSSRFSSPLWMRYPGCSTFSLSSWMRYPGCSTLFMLFFSFFYLAFTLFSFCVFDHFFRIYFFLPFPLHFSTLSLSLSSLSCFLFCFFLHR